jgi:hypothetical protein
MRSRSNPAEGFSGFNCFPNGETGIVISTELANRDSLVEYGFRPDYGSGPHLLLLTAAVKLARRDLSHPFFSAGAREFLNGSLVALFADAIGYEGSFT